VIGKNSTINFKDVFFEIKTQANIELLHLPSRTKKSGGVPKTRWAGADGASTGLRGDNFDTLL
jgi:hypothetical protein